MTETHKDIIALLPRELSIKILGYLRGPKTLCRCTAVSRAWNSLANDELIWRNLCFLRWSIQKHISLQLHPRVDYTSLKDSLSVKEIKGILLARKVDIRGLMEKSEFVTKLVSSLPKHSPNQEGIQWRSKWKASFIVAELDSKRIILNKDELCTTNWAFRMKHWPDEVQNIRAKFNPDYSFESDMFSDKHTMKWRFYMNDVQVESYPELVISRNKDWSFTMQNPNAIFISH
ncbi:hypothetical protein BCR33DRAFT_852237 [Rhizoclosmatium globosum]|uniref:F-box domain-containing protein n=1 Tax=Rhizoclosmatium globosum TaxID=329046 RepID=A0A1Y2C2N3_9FUNG|nr:hypothetical protein HDU99_005894 [Rhizoclosmatium hyalinum]ORY41216.1 hypothetical protein BCR33DRAFT_852237 [Rhizoclosmatium globosum]|eukprot:ORY41216.1 hypothetical protein BCR33DRAFT_852237 [Rhizoclosmatium globosum]